MKAIKWMSKNSKPLSMGFYYVRNEDGSLDIRHYEEDNGGSWWFPFSKFGYKPNDSFVEWAFIPEIHS